MAAPLDGFNTFDANALSTLKRAAHDNSPEAIKATAKQFEAVFLQMVLKSMRDASPKDGMLDSDTTRFYQGMSDQQLAGVLAQKGGIGLAAALERQLMRAAVSPETGATDESDADAMGLPQTLPVPRRASSSQQSPALVWPGVQTAPVQQSGDAAGTSPRQFVDKLWGEAQQAAKQLDVPAHFLIGQAALETGWGKSELKTTDGRPSYNLFNVKAGRDWTGPVVEAQTTEYENGQAVTRTGRFRAYASHAEAFADYAQLMQQSSRYAGVQGKSDAEGFARALQSGGYATDPAYSSKLTRVINGVTMRQALASSNSA